MPSFHAAYSLGGLLGALAGGALAGALGAGPHLLLVAAFGFVATVFLGALLARRAALRMTAEAPTEPRGGGQRWAGVDGSCSSSG